jgi:cytochrome c553
LMSKRVVLIEVSPEAGDLAAHRGEVFKSIHECPCCHGRGGKWLGNTDDGYVSLAECDENYRVCDRCAGTGKLEASVVIGWKPALPRETII